MDDQNTNQSQQPIGSQPQVPFGQPVTNDGTLGVNHNPTTASIPSTQNNLAPQAPPAKSFLDEADDDLAGLKQDALRELRPLVEHLDQTPEEKFKTTLMLIQASDDQSLLKTAYEAARQIGNEEERARALLDIVNEINYFSQRKK